MFRDSPHSFAQALAHNLQDLQLEWGTVLQYLDDLLICSATQVKAMQLAVQTLNFLASRGHKISRSKGQVVQQKVTYLGIILMPEAHSLSPERVQSILQLPDSTTRTQLRAFLSLTGNCWL